MFSDLTLLGLFFTIIALCLSIWQTWQTHRQMNETRRQSEEARRQAEEAYRQTEKLTAISNTLSTRYLGKFPAYYSEIVSVISTAKENLKIVCTIPMHCIYSDHDGWLDGKHALENSLKPSHRIDVSCVFANSSGQRRFLKNQLRDAVTNWSTYRAVPKNENKIKCIFEKYGTGNLDDLTSDGFFDLFETAANQELKTTYNGATVVHVSEISSLYMWVADGKEAVFVISTTEPSFFAEAFWTKDLGLIHALERMHLDYSTKAEQR
jgi:hypothetical protein